MSHLEVVLPFHVYSCDWFNKKIQLIYSNYDRDEVTTNLAVINLDNLSSEDIKNGYIEARMLFSSRKNSGWDARYENWRDEKVYFDKDIVTKMLEKK